MIAKGGPYLFCDIWAKCSVNYMGQLSWGRGSCVLHVEVSLSKILNPKLLPRALWWAGDLSKVYPAFAWRQLGLAPATTPATPWKTDKAATDDNNNNNNNNNRFHLYSTFQGTQGHLTKWNKHILKQTKQRINGASVSQHRGNSRTTVNTATSTMGNSTLRPEANLHLEVPCTQWGRHRRPRDPVPVTEPGAKRQQKSRSSRSEHLKTPPATAEHRPANITRAGGDYSSRGERKQSQAVNNPDVADGGPAEQWWTSHKASSASAYKLALLC